MIKKLLRTQVQFILITSCMLLAACSKKKEISGSVFIVTKGSENIKLGLVDVVAFNRTDFKEKNKIGVTNSVLSPFASQYGEVLGSMLTVEVGKNKAKEMFDQDPDMSIDQINRIKTIISDAEAKYNQIAEKFFESQKKLMPLLAESSRSKMIAKTDADGRFVLPDIGSDDTIAAMASRMVGDKNEFYAWVIKIEDIPQNGQIMLSNNNMAKDMLRENWPGSLAMAISLLYPEKKETLDKK
jgi:hypothetical protein